MRVLRKRARGPLVRRWQHFLLGRGYYRGEVDGIFGAQTDAATRAFQRAQGLAPVDGIVGNDTWGKAMTLGFQAIPPATSAHEGPGWPGSGRLAPATLATRHRVFGRFDFEHVPTRINPEAIRILGGWEAKYITTVEIPQLAGVKGAAAGGRVRFHRAVAAQLASLFRAWERERLLDRILTWDGSYVPRFQRGSRTRLSNHSWGTAFDINARWNPMGSRPALVGANGSVRELVKAAETHGFYWGGLFTRRPDGMHFEAARVL